MPKKVEVAKAATFTTDDKRAQYARLVVFNHGVKSKLITKDKTVIDVSQGDLQKAFKDLVGGTLLEGTGGIEYIQELTKKGATDEKVASRGLTTAYAQEVRPFIKKGFLSDSFGRRGKKAEAKPARAEKPSKSKKAAAKAAKPAPAEAPAVEEAVTA